jgi:glycosyltransferase involved in cell wall biosynthesis
MTNILQVVTDTDRRGAQVFACDLHAALEERGHQVSTMALAPGDVGGLDIPVLGPQRLAASTLRALHGEARRHQVVVAHGSTTLPACALALIGTRAPFVYRQISDSLFWASSLRRRVRVRAGLMRAARVVALWQGSARTLHQSFGVPDAKVRVVANGVPPGRFPLRDPAVIAERRTMFSLRRDAPTAVYAGALVPEKGVDTVLEALAQVPDLQLLIAGDGPERRRLEALAIQNAPGRVVFAGVLDDVASAYVAGDFVVLASRGGDSMPAALIEAGLMGIPAVSTAVEAIPEIVVDGETGFLATSASPKPFGAAMRRMVDDLDGARRMGDAARGHCLERYSIDRVAVAWENVIAELLPKAA